MSERTDSPQTPSEAVIDDHELSIEQIEAAYQRALETAEAAEALFPDDDLAASPSPSPDQTGTGDPEAPPPLPSPRPVSRSPALPLPVSPSSPEDALARGSADAPLSPRQVIEALLFVGGNPLPAKKLADVLGGSLSHEQIDEFIVELNSLYAAQNRPYEIRLVEGGYRTALLPEFETVRQKVYGQGPKEVKLAQDALEILAFIAYRQPATRRQLEATEKKNLGGLLRQLLRRELVALERGDEAGEESYRTTGRFLQLFGLGSLDDLPQAVDFDFK